MVELPFALRTDGNCILAHHEHVMFSRHYRIAVLFAKQKEVKPNICTISYDQMHRFHAHPLAVANPGTQRPRAGLKRNTKTVDAQGTVVMS